MTGVLRRRPRQLGVYLRPWDYRIRPRRLPGVVTTDVRVMIPFRHKPPSPHVVARPYERLSHHRVRTRRVFLPTRLAGGGPVSVVIDAEWIAVHNGGIDITHSAFDGDDGESVVAGASSTSGNLFWLNPGGFGRVSRITILIEVAATSTASSCDIWWHAAMKNGRILTLEPIFWGNIAVPTSDSFLTYYADRDGIISATGGDPQFHSAMFSSEYLAVGVTNTGGTTITFDSVLSLEYM